MAQAERNVELPDKILWLASKPKRIKIAVGGRGSAKSTGVGDLMLGFCGSGERICATREYQNSIDDSVHESLRLEIDRLGLESAFTVRASDIHGSAGGEIFYKGLARNITSLKSIAGVKRLWIEEGESVSKKSLKVLTPSVRSSAADNVTDLIEPPEIWITMNRGSAKDAVAEKYLSRAEKSLAKTGYYEDDLMMVVEVNWRDNPWFPPELEQERQDDYENLPRAEYDHIWEGKYYDTVDNAIITPEVFDSCVDAHIKLGFEPLGQERVAYDPADSGDDKAWGYQHGSVVLDLESTDSGDVNTATDQAIDFCIDKRADAFSWDGDGLGLSLKRDVATALDGKKVEYGMFRGSEGPDDPDSIYERDSDTKKQKTNKEAFRNKRAQYYFMLRDRMNRTHKAIVQGSKVFNPDELISFSSDIKELDQLKAELCAIPRKFNGSGRFELHTKQEMKSKYELDSPNRADVVMMLQRPVEVKKKAVKLNFTGWGDV